MRLFMFVFILIIRNIHDDNKCREKQAWHRLACHQKYSRIHADIFLFSLSHSNAQCAVIRQNSNGKLDSLG